MHFGAYQTRCFRIRYLKLQLLVYAEISRRLLWVNTKIRLIHACWDVKLVKVSHNRTCYAILCTIMYDQDSSYPRSLCSGRSFFLNKSCLYLFVSCKFDVEMDIQSVNWTQKIFVTDWVSITKTLCQCTISVIDQLNWTQLHWTIHHASAQLKPQKLYEKASDDYFSIFLFWAMWNKCWVGYQYRYITRASLPRSKATASVR